MTILAIGAVTARGAVGAEPARGAIGAEPAPTRVVIDDAKTGQALLGHFDYVGHWEHVRGKHDGRTNGTSTRSTHAGDVAIVRFNGTRVRLFGVRGPSGGRAGITVDEMSTGAPAEFYAPRVEPHALIYQSPVLPNGPHTLTIFVLGFRDPRGHFYYANIDDAEIESPAVRRATARATGAQRETARTAIR